MNSSKNKKQSKVKISLFIISLFAFSTVFYHSYLTTFANNNSSIQFGFFTPDVTSTPDEVSPTQDIPASSPTSVVSSNPYVDLDPSIVPPTKIKASPTKGVAPTNAVATGYTDFSNAGDCSKKSLGLYNPQPHLLGPAELCSNGSIAPYYQSTYVPPQLVNLKSSVGSGYLINDSSTLIRQEVVVKLRTFLDFIKSDCVPFVNYGYRNYTLQKQIWDDLGCSTNPNCGAAPPGGSTHQSGTTVDLFCAVLDANNKLKLTRITQKAIDKSVQYGFIHPLGWDRPHFVGL